MNSIRSTVLLCAGFITIVLAMFVLSVTRTPQLSDQELRAAGVFLLPKPRALTDFNLQDQSGAAYGLESLAGKWSFIFFGFTTAQTSALPQWRKWDRPSESCMQRVICWTIRCRECWFCRSRQRQPQ